jgi:hypothetical protein
MKEDIMVEADCDCGICNLCNGMSFDSELETDEAGAMLIQILDPNKDKILRGLSKILPPMNVEEIILLNNLRETSGLIKVAAKHKPNNPKLWAKCLADARRRFDVCPCVPVDFSYALSESGWKSYYDLKVGDKIISYNREKNQLEWDIIKNIHFYKDASTVRMYKANTCFDFISTKDHKWVIKNKERKKDTLSSYKERDYKYSDQLVSTENITKNMNLITSARMVDSEPISLKNFRKYDCSWVETILKMSNEQREAWLASAIVYDGHENSYSDLHKRGSYGFSQKNKDHGDAAAICAALLGYNVSFRDHKKDNPDITSFTFIDRQTHSSQNILKKDGGTFDVWCPETSNGTWLMKQKRMITITGNSAYCNAFAAKTYKKKGGTWRTVKKGGRGKK